MTPDVVVDIGNSRIKWGLVAGGRVTDHVSLPHGAPEDWQRQSASWRLGRPATWVVAGVNPSAQAAFTSWASAAGGRVVELNDYRSVPLKLAVESPEQVGIDRLLAALSAWSDAAPRPAVVVAIGTAVTADVVDETGTFLGGAILPGPRLMARALHEHTAKLPLVDATDLHTVYCPGRNTRQAIELGIGTAVGSAIRELFSTYSRLLDGPPVLFVTGGGMGPFTDLDPDEVWTPDPADTRFAPTLTLEGIRLAAEALLVTRVAVLTPAGTGAIATLAVVGADAWAAVRAGFRPVSGKPLPEVPVPPRFWFGKLGDGAGDEVVVAVKRLDPEPWVEVHCHGGRRVVRWAVEQFARAGCREVTWQELGTHTPGLGWAVDARALEPLTRAPTVRTAAVLLDQYHGAFARAVQAAVDDPAALAGLARFAPVGRHLVAPWAVAVVGPPNVGKSSLVNALAGYQRAVVSDVPGTTRDVVRTLVALDGWPVELADTAGLRDAGEELEAAGIDRTRRVLASADLAVWVRDAADPAGTEPDFDPPPLGVLVVANKVDLAGSVRTDGGAIPVSALTGAGVPELAAAVAVRLVPAAPPPGSAVPYTPALSEQTEQAARAVAAGNPGAARAALLRCLD